MPLQLGRSHRAGQGHAWGWLALGPRMGPAPRAGSSLAGRASPSQGSASVDRALQPASEDSPRARLREPSWHRQPRSQAFLPRWPSPWEGRPCPPPCPGAGRLWSPHALRPHESLGVGVTEGCTWAAGAYAFGAGAGLRALSQKAWGGTQECPLTSLCSGASGDTCRDTRMSTLKQRGRCETQGLI